MLSQNHRMSECKQNVALIYQVTIYHLVEQTIYNFIYIMFVPHVQNKLNVSGKVREL